jgi:hypothetical protein
VIGTAADYIRFLLPQRVHQEQRRRVEREADLPDEPVSRHELRPIDHATPIGILSPLLAMRIVVACATAMDPG